MRSFLLALGSALLMSTLDAKPIGTCEVQKDCIVMTVTEKATSVTSKPCTSADSPGCAFQVCMTLNMNLPYCQKSKTDTVSHTCMPDEGVCGGGLWQEVPNLYSGFQMCQTGKAGQTLKFLLKDGNGCADSQVSSYAIGSGALASCAPSTSKTCTGNSLGVECIWSVTLPPCSSSSTSSSSSSSTSNTGFGSTSTSDSSSITAQVVTGCAALEQQVPPDYLTYDSGVTSCSIDQAAGVLKDCDCVRPSADCDFLQCNKPIPDGVMATLQSMQC